MLDKSIPYFNVIMRYDGPEKETVPELPVGYCFSHYREGDALRWAQMEVDNNDFDTLADAARYFQDKYIRFPEKLRERFIGVRDSRDVLVGAVLCWNDVKDDTQVASVHWLLVDPTVQGKGIGTALTELLVYRFCKMKSLPIYLHTQPWSYPAIWIYGKVGFRLLKSDSFNEFENQTLQALEVLKALLPEQKMEKLIREML